MSVIEFHMVYITKVTHFVAARLCTIIYHFASPHQVYTFTKLLFHFTHLMSLNSTRASLSTSQQLDLWEHACLLYHSFEWQEAADAFFTLAQMAKDDSERMRYHVNTGLILARLGDLPDARVAFLLASKKDNRCALTHFLLGLIAVEMEDLVSALASFELCALRMSDEAVVDYVSIGLKFRLHAQLVADNISKVRTVVDGQAAFPGVMLVPPTLDGVSADLLFEAPVRDDANKKSVLSLARTRKSLGSLYSRRSTLARSTAVDMRRTLARSPPEDSRRSLTQTSDIPGDRTIRAPSPATSFHPSLLPAPLAPRLAPRTSIPPKPSRAPRDTVFDYKSTRELARFIRHTGPSTGGTKNFDVDRDYMLHLLKSTGVSTRDASPSTLEEAVEKPRLRRRASDTYGSVLDYYTTPAELRRKSLPDAHSREPPRPRSRAPSPSADLRSPPLPPSNLSLRSPKPGKDDEAKTLATVLQRRLSDAPAPSLVSSAGIFRMGLKDARARGWHL